MNCMDCVAVDGYVLINAVISIKFNHLKNISYNI